MPRKATTEKFAFVTAVALLSLLNAGVAQGSPSTSSYGERHLVKVTRCPGQVLSRSHRYRTLPARSALDCASRCRPDNRCLSFVFDSNVKECYLGDDVSRQDCSNMEPGHAGLKHYETVCHKEGEELGPGPEDVCVCSEGFRGKPCAPYIGDCTEGFRKGLFQGKGVYMIHPILAKDPFPVYCKDMSNVRTYIMDRRKNDISFNRNFSDYQAGFGGVDGDHWLGLDKVHQLTNSKDYELRISARLENGSNFFMQYKQFNVTGVETGYRLYFNQTDFNDTYLLGDCFSDLYGAQFSAFDHDNDEDNSVNCAAKHGGGWWFRGSNCSTCNPTGSLPTSTDELRSGVDTEIFWTRDMGDLAISKLSMFLVVI